MKTLMVSLLVLIVVFTACGDPNSHTVVQSDCHLKLDTISALMEQGNYEDVIVKCEGINVCDTFSRDRLMIFKANAYLYLHRFPEAIDSYSQLIAVRPSSPEAFKGRAMAYERMGEYDSAYSDYTRALNLDSTLSYERISRADVLRKLGRYDEAIKDLDFLIQHEYIAADVYNNYGLTMSDQGKFSESLEYFELAFKLDSLDATAYNYSISLYHLGQYDKSLNMMNTAIRLNPEQRDFYYNRALIKVKLNDRSSACADFEIARSMGVNVDQDVKENCK